MKTLIKHIFSSLAVIVIMLSCEQTTNEGNLVPECTITSPLESDYFFSDESINITIEAEDEDGNIKEVNLYIEGDLQKTFLNPPYQYQWTNPDKIVGNPYVYVSVTDNNGTDAFADLYLTILEPGTIAEPPVADFSYNSTLIQRDRTVEFTDLSINNPTQWNWHFGDGDTSTTQNPMHVYSIAGTYSITLIASSFFGTDTVFKEKAITVINENPEDIQLITDIDGNEYRTTIIGSQLWMAENLKTQSFNDGTPIPHITENDQWENMNSPAYSWYNNDSVSYHNTYGPLYNWYTVDTEKLCPAGWHVATHAEWYSLGYFAQSDSLSGQLKEIGFDHWNMPNEGAIDMYGFSALPGGRRYEPWGFGGMGKEGSYWHYGPSSGEYDFVSATRFEYDNDSIHWVGFPKDVGFSVRCLRDKLLYE